MNASVKLRIWPLLAALSVLLLADGQEQCRIYYLTQPPSQLTCNPYLDTTRFSLRIECMAAVHRSIGGSPSDFEIRWFAQLVGKPIPEDPQELVLNDTTTFGDRINQTIGTEDFLLYHSQARITGTGVSAFDRFWCQITASEGIRNTTDITDLARSEATAIAERDYYISPLLPSCPQTLNFYHQTSLKCADVSVDDLDNVTLSEPPVVMPSSSTMSASDLDATNCPPPAFRDESGETSRLVSVLLPSLMLPVIVAVLLVIAALIMTCGRRTRNLLGKQKRRRVNEEASMENLTDPVITPPPASAAPLSGKQQASTLKETTTQAKPPPPRPPHPALKPPIKNTNRATSPQPTGPTSSTTAAPPRQPSNRFSQDIYDDIADSALDSYSMSHNDIYSMKPEPATGRGDGLLHEVNRLPHLNGPFLSSKVGRRDESGIGHYKNAALISISDRTTPMLISKKTAASLPSLIDPKHYHNTASPRRRPNEAPDTLRSSKPQKGDLYDTLAKKTPDPTYYNQLGTGAPMESSGSLARLIEDEEPDYDEVDEEDEEAASIRGRGDSAGSTRPLAAYPLAARKLLGAARQQNCVSVMSESYEDMSGMDDFIESYKSATSTTPL